MAVSLNYCTPLHLNLKLCDKFNRQKQENDKIKFWKSVPSYVLVRKYQWRKKIIFIPSNKWEKIKNVLYYRQQIAYMKWTASSEFGTYSLCEQRRFRRACTSAQSRQNLRCSRIQAVSQEEPSDRKPDPWPLWMSGHAQLNFVMTECSKTQIRLTGLKYHRVLHQL